MWEFFFFLYGGPNPVHKPNLESGELSMHFSEQSVGYLYDVQGRLPRDSTMIVLRTTM